MAPAIGLEKLCSPPLLRSGGILAYEVCWPIHASWASNCICRSGCWTGILFFSYVLFFSQKTVFRLTSNRTKS